MKTRDAALGAMLALGAAGAVPCAAHDAPRLVEYFQGVEHAPNTGEATSAGSVVESSTLDAIHDDPSAVDVQVGMAFPDAVRDARALSLELPDSNDAGPDVIASFGNLQIEQRAEDDYSVYGRNESPASETSLVVMGADVVGTITYEGESYEVRPLGGGLTAVYRRDTSQWPEGSECGVTGQALGLLPPERSRESGIDSESARHRDSPPETDASPAGADNGEVIDLLVAYTADAQRAAGNIDGLIRLFFDETNRYFSNSEIRTRVRLVHSYRTNYRQADQLLADIIRLQMPDDGVMDEAHALRDQYGADLVALLVARRRDFCGRGDIYYGRESGSFSVTAQDCGAYIFAHELGHNLGAHHDPGTDTNTGFPYGHGFCNSRGNWRTIMSYNFQRRCWPRVPHFSNPDVSYRGTRTGDAQKRNNARVLNETAFHVANFRKALPPAHSIPLVMSADDMARQGFLRIINRTGGAGNVRIDAFDDEGRRFGPVNLSIEGRQTRHFNSMDLERGNAEKGLSRGIGNGRGDWRLVLATTLDVKTRAYVRTSDGFLTSIHEVAAEEDAGSMRYRVPTFNPGKNKDQQSRLRLINVGDGEARIEVSGVDDNGDPAPEGKVSLTLPARAARTLTAEELERGGTRGVAGRFGTGAGKWRLSVSADRPIQVMSLLLSRTGNLTNLSR